MYIPTQEERYSKVALFTLILCVMVPSAVVAACYSSMSWMAIIGACAWPLAYPIVAATGNMATGLVISTAVQLAGFLMLSRSKMPSKKKTTIAILWGMSFALAVRIILAYELKQAVIRAYLEAQ